MDATLMVYGLGSTIVASTIRLASGRSPATDFLLPFDRVVVVVVVPPVGGDQLNDERLAVGVRRAGHRSVTVGIFAGTALVVWTAFFRFLALCTLAVAFALLHLQEQQAEQEAGDEHDDPLRGDAGRAQRRQHVQNDAVQDGVHGRRERSRRHQTGDRCRKGRRQIGDDGRDARSDWRCASQIGGRSIDLLTCQIDIRCRTAVTNTANLGRAARARN